MQYFFIVFKQFCTACVSFIHNALDFGVNQSRGAFAEVLVLHPFAPDKDFFAGFADGQRAYGLAHAPFAHHLAGHARDALDVVGSAGGDIIKNKLFSHPAAQQHHKGIAQIRARIAVAVFFGQLHGHAKGAATRDDGYLVHRIRPRQQTGHQGVTTLVIGGDALFVIGQDKAATLAAHEHLVLGVFKIVHVQSVLIQLGGLQSRFVDQIFQVSAGETGCAACQNVKVHVAGQGRALGVHLKDATPATQIGRGHDHLTVETTGTQQGRVQHVGTVGGGNEDDALIAFKAVHFNQHLVQGLLAFVVPAAEPGSALTAHGVNFVNKDKAGSIFFALHKKVAHARSAHAHKHFHKVRAGNGKEGNPRLTGHGACKKGLTRAGRAHEQNALGNAPAKAGKLFGIGQKFHNFGQFVLGLINPGHIGKSDPNAVLTEHACFGTAKIHGLAAAALHLAHKENPHAHKKQHGKPRNQQGHIPGLFFGRLCLDFHLFFNKAVDEPQILRSICLNSFAV